VVDPKHLAVDGAPLRYGDEVTLVDDQGMAWNNMQVRSRSSSEFGFARTVPSHISQFFLSHSF
jgi:hypothetical protein